MALQKTETKYARAFSVGLLTVAMFGGMRVALANQSAKPAAPLRITTKALPKATAGVEYYAVIAATGGEPPYDCTGKGLPANIAFHPNSDTLAGKATAPGTYPVVITVEDSADPPHTASANFTLTVEAAK
jgi:putative Ig domain-containing protein